MSHGGFKCMLCGATEFRPWLTNCADYYLQKGRPVDYVECNACSLVQQFPFPADVSALYADYPVHSSRNTVQRLARRIFQRQVYFRPASGSGQLSLLDYGCGDGTFLREMQGRGNAVCGFEPGDTHSAALSSQLNMPIYSSTEKLCQELAGTLNIITAHFVLEHVSDLRGAFTTFQTLLKPGGTLYIAVPNIRSWESLLFKKRWHGLDAPRHLIFPEASHFKTLAEEYGFGVPQISFAAFPNTLAASLATMLAGRCQPVLLMGLIVPGWLVALGAPQGTLAVRMIRT
ncbi:MAG: class I SAM-dependent methyltransferase [Kiritimatiellaceae bacterium]|nr:class I SAM-dependent methyltransferase [Kiritimatiellaceae bacterium]